MTYCPLCRTDYQTTGHFCPAMQNPTSSNAHLLLEAQDRIEALKARIAELEAEIQRRKTNNDSEWALAKGIVTRYREALERIAAKTAKNPLSKWFVAIATEALKG